jgi:hypothetical protein
MRLPDFLHGAADLHVHSSPDVDPRRYDDIDLAREAARAGMSALLIKSHQNSTVERATLVSRIVPGIRILGGLVLNETVGGLNPAAVEVALRLGARQVWMPTRSARNHRWHLGPRDDGITIFGPDGRVVPAVDRILDLIAPSECVLGTGHLSPKESVALIGRARARGVRRILVTHPEWKVTFFPCALQRELAADRGLWFERCYVSTTHRCGFTPMKTITDAIADVGIASTILSTDLGQPDTPPPVEGLCLYAEALRASGFSADDIRRMSVDHPCGLLGVSSPVPSAG